MTIIKNTPLPVRTLCLTLALFGLCTPGQANASVNILELSPEQLLSAEVTSVSKRAEPVSRAPAAVYVITAEDIARSGVQSIPDALRMAPGVDVAQGDSNSWAVNIRGFNKGLADQLLVMIDGRTVYNPLFAGTYWELQDLPLEDIERIEVVRGPGGTLWGANAVNGVINIITKKAQDTQGNLVSLGAGNYQHDFGLGQTGGKIGDDSYYRVYGQHFNDGSFNTPQGADNKDSWDDTRTGFRFDQGDTLTVSGDVYDNDADQMVSIPHLTRPLATIESDDLKSQGANILAHWKKQYDGGGLLSLQSYLDYTKRDQLTLSDEEDIFDLDAQYNMPVQGPHEFTFGGGYRVTHEDIGNTPTLSIDPANISRNVFNMFAQDKIAIVPDKWFLTLGSKVEHNDFTGVEFEPNARLQWFPDNRQTVWAAVSHAVRTPSPLERDIDLNAGVFPKAVPLEFNLAANPDFNVERLNAYELGYRNQITPAVSTDIAAFYNQYDGLAAQQFVGLFLVPPLPFTNHLLFQTTQANLMQGETHGIEIAADWHVNDSWKLSGGYSYLTMALTYDNDFTKQEAEERQSPHHQANVRSYWNITKDWSLDTSLYYVSRLSSFGVPSYLRADANLGWRVTNGLQFNLIGQNLLDSEHQEFNNATDLNAAVVPRTVFGKLTWRF